MSEKPETSEVSEVSEVSEGSEAREAPEAHEAPEVSEGAKGAAATPETPAATETLATPEKPARRIRPRRIAAIAASALLVCAVLGGVGYTAVTVQDADRDAGKPTWTFPPTGDDAKGDQQKDREAKKSASGLSGMFVPFSSYGYTEGPDLGKFGVDAEFNGAQATDLRKQSLKGLPSSSRREMEKLVDEQHIQGMAMRSYLIPAGTFSNDNSVTLSVTLLRLKNSSAVRRMSTSLNTFIDSADLLRKGPEIKGHKGTRCYLTPKGKSDELGTAFCAGYVGDVLVTVTADGPEPIDAGLPTQFFTEQLDRIDDPGMAV
ncbi:hypothetical protein ACJ6WF_19395 [Streptomyces sp. MMS24-I2-30]|uniref:hypothetical protein n=1 Tax=Streptomyces sp. MMS24-I2-30 TaxID=3351564 RepID=UPI0038969B56